MDFDPTFFQQEFCSGFPVTEKRRKIWATELGILEQFDKVCRKFHLTWYAGYGTLLGAVRHQGFIPWDDDIDIVMFRDDYEEFQAVAPREFEEPYCFQNTYSCDRLCAFSKIRDSRTTAVEFPDMPESYNQGIFIDIFPLDSVRDDGNPQSCLTAGIQRLLWIGIVDPDVILRLLEQDGQSLLNREFLLDYMKKDRRERFRIFEAFNGSHSDESRMVNFITDEICPGGYRSVQREWFRETVYLPFENIQIPAPVEYDRILRRWYGDYEQFVRGTSCHEGIILDPDMPYREYLRKKQSS